MVSTKKFGSAGVLGSIYEVIKTLKLQYHLNGMYYGGGWSLIGKKIRYGMKLLGFQDIWTKFLNNWPIHDLLVFIYSPY